MRKRFTQQLSVGQIPIEDAQINPKSKNALNELLAALHAIYCDQEYNKQIFSLLEKYISGEKKRTGRNGSLVHLCPVPGTFMYEHKL